MNTGLLISGGATAGGGILAMATGDLGILTQTVQVNLVTLLVLTFVPTSDLINFLQSHLKKRTPDNQGE